MLRYVQWPQIAPQAAAALVYRVPALPVGRRVHDPGGAARRRDTGAAHLQPAALRPQRAGERALPDAAGPGRGAPSRPKGVAACCVLRIPCPRNTQHASRSSSAPSLTLLLTGCAPELRPRTRRRSTARSSIACRSSAPAGSAWAQFNKPRSVAVDKQDNLYVVDMTGRVQKFSSNGVFLLSWQMPQTDLGKPKGMGHDRDGNIFVVEPHYQRVNRLLARRQAPGPMGQARHQRGRVHDAPRRGRELAR